MAPAATASSTETPDLPEDLLAVREVLVSMADAGETARLLEVVISLLAKLRRENTQLSVRVQELLRTLYGRKSDQVSSAQLALVLESLELASESESESESEPAVPPPARGKRGRKPLPAHLPRRQVDVPVPAQERVCETCGGEKTCFGHQTSEILDFVPGRFEVVEERREKLACRVCGEGVVVADSLKVREKGRPGSGLLADLLVSKFADSLPLYRQGQRYARLGVELSSSTLGEWTAFAVDLLAPLAGALRREVFASRYVKSDDTPLRVLDRDAANGVKKGHIWTCVGGEAVVFTYTPSWHASQAHRVLGSYEGFVQGDGYAGYEAVLEGHGVLVPEERRLGCMMHVRSKFVAALQSGDARAAVALSYLKSVYEIERELKEQKRAPEVFVLERHERRQTESVPLLSTLRQWLDAIAPTLVPKTPLHKAVTYAQNQWTRVLRCFSDGRFEIDNGEAERQLRIVALGRKNYLFAGSDEGAERIAIAYTVVGSCRLAGVNPYTYLRDVLTKLQNGWPHKQLGELLPARWKERHEQEATPAASA